MLLYLSSKDIKKERTFFFFWQIKLIKSLYYKPGLWKKKKKAAECFSLSSSTPPAFANRHGLWQSFINKRLKHQFSSCCFSKESYFFLGRVIQNWACRLSIQPPAPAFSAHQFWMSAMLFQHPISSLTWWGVRTGCPSCFTGLAQTLTWIFASILCKTRRLNTNSRCHQCSPFN